MYNTPDTDAILREGLHTLPVPAPGPDFDARVLSALHAPPSWWEILWNTVRGEVRPLLTGAACGLPVTMLALLWTLHAPLVEAPPAPNSGGARVGIASRVPPELGVRGVLPARGKGPSVAPTLDALLDKPNLTSGDLRRWEWAQMGDSPPALPTPAPRRHASLPDPPTLAA